MRIFRECPSYPGYSAALCGVIRREAWTSRTKLGNPSHRAAMLLRPAGPGGRYVYVRGALLKRTALVADAWPPHTRTIDQYLTR